MTFAILYHPELKEYDFGPGHPFRGNRYTDFPLFLDKHLPPDDNYRVLRAEPASEDDLQIICHPEYIRFTSEYYKAANRGLSLPGQFSSFQSGDNHPIGNPGKLEEAARLIIGQAKQACDLVQSGEFKKVVSIGGGMHHAKSDYGEGFCIYNDVAYCGHYLVQEYNLDRILILDTDAHAGNGTSHYFYEDPRALFIDIHQDPGTLYPGTGFSNQIGNKDGKGYTINIPMPVNAGDDSYRLVFDTIVEPVVKEYNPQVIIRNGGSDLHFADGLTNLGLTIDGFRMLGQRVSNLAGVCGGKVIDLIASGYNEEVSPYGWLALIVGLNNIDYDVTEPVEIPAQFLTDFTFPSTEKMIGEVKNQLGQYWRCLRQGPQPL